MIGNVIERNLEKKFLKEEKSEMKNLKKILALVLAFACAFTMFAVAGAAEFTDKASIKNYEAVNTLVALNIIQGRANGSFDPDATVTRAEMAKMIYVIWNGGKDDATAYETMKSSFSDVSDHWARGYINFCAANKIIAGMGDGTFAPDQTVTGQQAAKMLLVLMGYDDQHAKLTGPEWRQNTMSYAGLAGLFKNVESPVEQGMPRQYAAQMVYNTLEANRVKWSTDNNAFDEITTWMGSTFRKETVGRKYMNYVTETGILVEARNGDAKGFTLLLPNNSGKYSWGGSEWAETKYAVDLSEYLGQEVKVSYNEEEYNYNRDCVYGVYSTENNMVVTTTANKMADAKEDDRIKLDGTKYKLDDNLRYYYSLEVDSHATDLTSRSYETNSGNGRLATIFGDGKLYADYEPSVANTVKFVDYDNDGKFDVAIDYPMAVAEVSMVSSSAISLKDVRGVKLTTTAPKRDDVVEYEGIAKGDIVQVTWDTFHDKMKLTKMETVDETIGSVRNGSDNKNEEFNLSSGWVKRFAVSKNETTGGTTTTKTGKMGQNAIDTKLKSGDKATFVVIGGVAYYVDRTQSGTGNDVAVVVNTGETGGGAADDGAEAKLMFADGTTSIVDVVSIIDNKHDNEKHDLDDDSANGYWRKTLNTNQLSNTHTVVDRLDYYLSGETNKNDSYNKMLKNGSIAPALVTYSRSGNDYTLQLLDQAENDAGYDEVLPSQTWNTDGSDAKVGNFNLLDDGTVFVVYNTSNVKRYTGTQAKKLKDNIATKTFALVEKSNGVSRVRVAAVYAKNGEPEVSGVGNYAYLLDKANAKTINGTSYIILDAYTKNGAETLYYEENASATKDYDKGTIVDFSYTTSVINDNGAEYKLIDDLKAKPVVKGAVTGWDRNDITIVGVNGDIATWDVDTDDTTVLIVDTDGKVGVSVGKEGIQTADEPQDGVYKVNAAYYHIDGSDAFDLIVIDSLNNWLDKDELVVSAEKNAVNNMLAMDGKATVYLNIAKAQDITVPKDAVLTVDVSDIVFVQTSSKAFVVETLSGDAYDVDKDTNFISTLKPVDLTNIEGAENETGAKLEFVGIDDTLGKLRIQLTGKGTVSLSSLKDKTLKWNGKGWN